MEFCFHKKEESCIREKLVHYYYFFFFAEKKCLHQTTRGSCMKKQNNFALTTFSHQQMKAGVSILTIHLPALDLMPT